MASTSRTIRVRFDGDSHGLSRAAHQGERSVGGFGRGLGKLKTLAAGVAIGLGVVATATAGVAAAAGALGLDFANMQQRALISFESLLGSGQSAQRMWSDVTAFAKRTPFELAGVTDAARGLLGVGVASDKVIPTLQKFGNLSSAYGQSQDEFNRTMLASKQIIGAGKAQWEDLAQVQEAGIPILQLLADHLGVSVGKVKELASEGKISSKDFLASIDKVAGAGGKFAGAMDKQSKTLAGTWSSLKDTFSQTFGEIILRFAPQLTAAMEKLGPIVQAAATWWSEKYLPAAMAVWRAIADRLVPVLKDLWHWFQDKVLPVLREVAQKALEGLRSALDTVRGAIEENRPQLESLWRGFKQVADFVATYVLPLLGPILKFAFEQLGRQIGLFIDILSTLVDAFHEMNALIRGAMRVFNEIVLGSLYAVTRAAADVAGALGMHGLEARLNAAANSIERFKNDANRALGGIADRTVNLRIVTTGGAAGGAFMKARAHGGPVDPFSLYQVNELGTEMLTMGGRDYLLTGAKGGHVTPADQVGGNVEVRVYLGDQELRGMVRTEVRETNRDLKRRALAGVR